MARKKRRKSSKRRGTKRKVARKTSRRKASRTSRKKGKGQIPLPILEKRAGKLVRLVTKRGGRVK